MQSTIDEQKYPVEELHLTEKAKLIRFEFPEKPIAPKACFIEEKSESVGGDFMMFRTVSQVVVNE